MTIINTSCIVLFLKHIMLFCVEDFYENKITSEEKYIFILSLNCPSLLHSCCMSSMVILRIKRNPIHIYIYITACNYTCNGDREFCGGVSANSVYYGIDTGKFNSHIN